MKQIFFLIVFVLLPLHQVLAQPLSVKGKVTDESGQPVIGATVSEKGTTNGTITGLTGEYQITVAPGATLLFRFVGFADKEVKVAGRTTIDVELSEQTEQLDEVMVIGYGTRKKRDNIGSVSMVTSEELKKTGSASFTEALQGRAAGVSVSSSSGVPGSKVNIKIRGVNSLSINTDPLWIVDGMPIYSGGGMERTIGSTSLDPMSMINPNDIESIVILKDAAATSIYGSRGSNGVIIVTTKSGTSGKRSTNLDYTAGFTNLSRTSEDIGYTNTTQWFSLVDQARANSGLGLFQPSMVINFFKDNPLSTLTRDAALNINTNWFDQILTTGNYQNLNLSHSGGSDNGTYYLSLNYNDSKGPLRNNYFKVFNVRANLDLNVSKTIKFGARLNLMYNNSSRVQQQVGGATGNNNGGASAGFGNANRNALPWYPIYDPNHSTGYWNPMSGSNLVAAIDFDHHLDDVKKYRGLGGVYAEYSPSFIKGLKIRSEGSFDIIQNNSVFWVSKYLREFGSYAFDRAVTRTAINYNAYANYDRQFGENHNLSLTFGPEATRVSRYIRDMEGQNLSGTYKQLGTPQDMLSMRASFGDEDYMLGFLGRAEYKFKDRYLFGSSLRRDGSSKFDPKYRWSLFTSFSAGWIITQESFMDGIEFLNFLKLRGSFGQTGNNGIPNDRFTTNYSNNAGDRYGTKDLISGGTRISNLGTPTLTWETTNSYDGGIDYGFLQNRISGSVAYYKQVVKDLLLRSDLPPSAGVSGIYNNIGDMQNQGWEFSITSVNFHDAAKRLKWTTSFNITTNKNKVLSLTPRYDQEGLGIDNGWTKSVTGGRLWTYYLCEWAGVDPEKGVDMIYEIDYKLWEETGKTVKTGRVIPATQTNLARNRIILEDKTNIPSWYGGLSNTVNFGNFDLSVLFTFSGGNYIYDYEEQRTTSVQYGQVVLRNDMIGNAWEKEGDKARYPELVWDSKYDWGWDIDKANPEWTGDPGDPRATGYWTFTGDGDNAGVYNNESGFYTKYLYKGDYVRLKNLEFGYTLPAKWLAMARIQSFRLYFQGANLWTWTKEYKGWDPESGGGVMPSLRVYTFGANLRF